MAESSNVSPGFYYHYKHNPTVDEYNYVYEVLNIAHNTEMKDTKESQMVIYRPLYESAFVYQNGKHWDAKPLSKFIEPIVLNPNGESVNMPRYVRITNEKLIKLMMEKASKMY